MLVFNLKYISNNQQNMDSTMVYNLSRITQEVRKFIKYSKHL